MPSENNSEVHYELFEDKKAIKFMDNHSDDEKLIKTIHGKTYKAKTNAKGIVQKTLGKNVIKKLKKGKTYTVKVTYLTDTIKSTVKVK